MKVWYFLNFKGHKVGSLNESKIRHMANGGLVFSCDISRFNGQLLSFEFN